MAMVKPSIVIPLGKSTCDYLDLKYSLRSIEKYASGYGSIVIIGENPKQIKNVIGVPFKETFSEQHKDRNILEKLKYACSLDFVTDNFIMFNDDFILLKETDLSEYPNYHKGELVGMLKAIGTYRLTMRHTLEYLLERGKETLNFDTHCPIIYNKQKFLATFDAVDFDIPFGYGIKSMYANLNDIKGQYMPDCKISGRVTRIEVEQKCDGRHIISCNEAALRHGLGDYLKEKFATKSIHE